MEPLQLGHQTLKDIGDHHRSEDGLEVRPEQQYAGQTGNKKQKQDDGFFIREVLVYPGSDNVQHDC